MAPPSGPPQLTRLEPARHRLLVGGLWSAVVVLTTIGVVAAIARGTFPADLTTRVEPFRSQVFQALDRVDPLSSQRAAELERVDSRFRANPVATRWHVLPGGAFLLLAPLQFSSRFRSRHIRVHRWCGRALLLAAFVTSVPALYFGLLMPYGGPGEAVAIAFFGGFFLVAISRAFVAIRAHQVARHREWMIRAFAVAIGISTVRVAGAVVDITLTPAGFGPRVLFVLALWTGWVITLGAAELWILTTRPRTISPSTVVAR